MEKSKSEGKRRVVETTENVEDIIRQVLAGHQRLVSHGASQYRGGGVSACGIAALNCARIILTTERDGLRDEELLRFVLDPSTAEKITSICNRWSGTLHLDVEDIFRVPLFSNSLTLVSSNFARPNFDEFKLLLLELKKHSPHAASCAVVTRPPEIVACVKIPTSSTDVFLIYDSHPRPSHPDGAGFIFSTTINTAARYLTNLLAVDRRLLADNSMQWQTQLLANFSGHIFVSNACHCGTEELSETVLESSLAILALREEIKDLKNKNSSLMEDKRRMGAELSDMKAKYRRAQRQLTTGLSSSPSQNNSQSSARTGAGVIASASQVHNELYNHPSSPPRQALVYYSGEPCAPVSSAHSTSRPEANDDSSDFSAPEDSGITLAMQIQFALGDSPHYGSQKALEKQREFEEEDRRLTAERMELLADSVQTTFCCTVCFEDHPEDYIARITGCEHTFCRDCLRGYIVSKLSDHRYPIFCPVCIADNGPNEPRVVTDSVIRNIGIPEDSYRILEELQLSAFSILLHCRKCKRSAFVDRTEYQESRLIACPLPGCLFAWCKACHQAIVIGGPQHSCDGSSELEHLMKMRGWKHCPGCTTPIQKDSGCNHMTCMSPGCNAHFCYVCGELIIKSALGTEIRSAISAHYRRCTLFVVDGE